MPTNQLGAHDCEAREQPTDTAYTCPECGEIWTWWAPTSTWERPEDTERRLQFEADMAAAQLNNVEE